MHAILVLAFDLIVLLFISFLKSGCDLFELSEIVDSLACGFFPSYYLVFYVFAKRIEHEDPGTLLYLFRLA